MRFLRFVLLSLLASLLFGMLVGTLIRVRLEKPVYYIGSRAPHLDVDARTTAWGKSGNVAQRARAARAQHGGGAHPGGRS